MKNDSFLFDVVKTQIGRCFRIGTAAQLAEVKAGQIATRIPSYACVYDDHTYSLTEKNAAWEMVERIVRSVNSNGPLVEALEASIPCMEAAEIGLRAQGCTSAAGKCFVAIAEARAAIAVAKEGQP